MRAQKHQKCLTSVAAFRGVRSDFSTSHGLRRLEKRNEGGVVCGLRTATSGDYHPQRNGANPDHYPRGIECVGDRRDQMVAGLSCTISAPSGRLRHESSGLRGFIARFRESNFSGDSAKSSLPRWHHPFVAIGDPAAAGATTVGTDRHQMADCKFNTDRSSRCIYAEQLRGTLHRPSDAAVLWVASLLVLSMRSIMRRVRVP